MTPESRTRWQAAGPRGASPASRLATLFAAANAFTDALKRRDNTVKAQHFFTANWQSVGSLGQLRTGGAFQANLDVNYRSISDSDPAAVPREVIVRSGENLRTIAARACACRPADYARQQRLEFPG